MTRSLVAAALSLALGLGSLFGQAAPASADSDSARRLLGGLAVIGAAAWAANEYQQRQEALDERRDAANPQPQAAPRSDLQQLEAELAIQAQRIEARRAAEAAAASIPRDYGEPPVSSALVPDVSQAPLASVPSPASAGAGAGVTPEQLRDWTAAPAGVLQLPASCLRSYAGASGGAMLDDSCLSQAGVADLPLACAGTVRSEGRFVSGWQPDCLRARGYRIAVR